MKHILPLVLAALALVSCAGPDSDDAVLVSSESALSDTSVVCGLCPPGYTRASSTCPARCDSPEHPCLPRLGNESTCVVNATGTLSATPANVRINLDVTQTGTTNVCFDVSGVSEGEVWLSVKNQPEVLFARGDNFCQAAPWSTAGNTFAFKLYSGRAHTTLLATATVTGEGSRGGTCGPCQSGDSSLENRHKGGFVEPAVTFLPLSRIARARVVIRDEDTEQAGPPCGYAIREVRDSNYILLDVSHREAGRHLIIRDGYTEAFPDPEYRARIASSFQELLAGALRSQGRWFWLRTEE